MFIIDSVNWVRNWIRKVHFGSPPSDPHNHFILPARWLSQWAQAQLTSYIWTFSQTGRPFSSLPGWCHCPAPPTSTPPCADDGRPSGNKATNDKRSWVPSFYSIYLDSIPKPLSLIRMRGIWGLSGGITFEKLECSSSQHTKQELEQLEGLQVEECQKLHLGRLTFQKNKP